MHNNLPFYVHIWNTVMNPFRTACLSVRLLSSDVMMIRYHLVDKWFISGTIATVGLLISWSNYQNGSIVAIVIGSISIVVAVGIILLTTNTKVCTLDKMKGTVTFQEKGFTTHRIEKRPLKHVYGVGIDEKVIDQREGEYSWKYRLSVFCVYLKLGINDYYRVTPYLIERDHEKTARSIRRFLELKGQIDDPTETRLFKN